LKIIKLTNKLQNVGGGNRPWRVAAQSWAAAPATLTDMNELWKKKTSELITAVGSKIQNQTFHYSCPNTPKHYCNKFAVPISWPNAKSTQLLFLISWTWRTHYSYSKFQGACNVWRQKCNVIFF